MDKDGGGTGNTRTVLARTTTRSASSSSNNNMSGNSTLRTPKQGVDNNLFPHDLLCDGHLQHSLMTCGHCYKWHRAGECVCESPYFKKLQADLKKYDPTFFPCAGPVRGHHTTCYANLHLIESSLSLIHCAIDNGAIDDFQRDGSGRQPASQRQVLQWHSDCSAAEMKYLMEHRSNTNPPDFIPPAPPKL
eukprot:CAMPEP_0185760128 /NCGR_PEP_ID=MMETSP1174-20130828/18980_1 /TAXON_ID=35687 /ORGANISM="Dictyocha speculum, Strain CCMP1381" /LENGTH=189 /DNA_ID=CAMNT_0028440811 /DNA_START=41 /DNA_END=610 /DNA_ORIENTATION=-